IMTTGSPPVRKCALLTRVSTTMQSRVEEGALKNQLERLRAHLAYRNSNYDERWVEIDTYEMKAVSGKDALRSKEFQRLFEDIRLKRVNVILAGSLDRVSRSVKDFQHLLEVLTKEEVELISLKETLHTSTAHGRFFVNLMASLAELERDRTAERNSATTLSRADRGLWNGGMLLGYDLGEKKGSLVVNEREAEIVRTAFETYLQTGSILKTVTTLNDRGFRTKGYSSRRGKTHPPKRFWYTSMRWLLCNPAYIAKKEVNKKKRPLDQSRLPESQRYRVVDANWPPIVSKETFDKVQLLLGENLRSGHNRADTKKHVYLLQGLVTCGKCTGHMEGRSGTGRLGQRYYFYVCKNKDCGFRVAEKELLKVVLGRIGKIARSPRLLGTLVSITNENLHAEVPALQTRKATLEREVDEIKGQAERLLDGVGLEGFEGEVFLKEKLSELGKRRSGLETTIAEIETTIEQIKKNAVNQEGVLASLAKFRSLYQTLPPYQQREGIKFVIANVKISEDALEISILGRRAPEEVLEKLSAPGMHSPRRSEPSTWLPGLMSRSAVVRDYRALEVGRRRANRLVLSVAG